MSYNRGYQGGSPWASGAPPQMYGGPPLPPAHPQPQHGGYGAGAPPAYGSPQVGPNAYGYNRHQMGPNHPINPPVPPVWGQGPIGAGAGPMQMNNQRGGNMRPMGGPTGKRSGHWNDMPPNKRFNRGNRNGGHNNAQGGNNRKDGRKFDNRQFPRDNKKNQNKQVKDEKQKQQKIEQTEKVNEILEKEYVVKEYKSSETKDSSKKDEINEQQARYLVSVNGFCCKLCNVFIRDKHCTGEHCEQESHIELFKKAEEERLSKEKEESEKKTNVSEVQSSEKVNDTKDENTEKDVKLNTDEPMNDNQVDENGDGYEGNDDESAQIASEDADESNLPINGDVDNKDDKADKDDKQQQEKETKTTSETIVEEAIDEEKKPEQVESKSEVNVGETNQQPIDLSESTGDNVQKESATDLSKQQTEVAQTPVQNFNTGRGGIRGSPRGRGSNRGGGNRGNRGNNRARGGGRGRR